MLFKISLAIAMLVTISFGTHRFMANFKLNALDVVEFSDSDFAKDKGKVNEKGELLFSDSDMDQIQVAVPTVSEGSSETVNNKDGSTTKTAFDGFGNKLETKMFANHPRIKKIKVQTTTKGEKRVFVYSQTGMVENIPQNMMDSVLSSSPDKIANAAGIYDTRADKERRKEDKANAKRDRQRKIDVEEFNKSRESLPNPVYPEYDKTADRNSDGKQESTKTESKSPTRRMDN